MKQIYVADGIHADLTLAAAIKRVSLSELVGQYIKKGIETEEKNLIATIEAARKIKA